MSCGCGCNNCGGTTPRVSGTEITILSGTEPANSNPTSNPASSSHTWMYVAGSAIAVSLLVFFATREK